MAPTVVNTALSQNKTGSSVALTMPSSLVADRLLLLLTDWGQGASGYNVSGWTLITNALTQNTAVGIAAWAQVSTGSNTATVTTNDVSSQNGCAICYQISGWSGTLANVTGTGANNGAGPATPDPPSHTGTYFRDNLWIAVGARFSAVGSDAAPTNYGNLQVALLNSSTYTYASAERALNTQTENPGAFSPSGAQPVAMTICIPPLILPSPTQPRARLIRASHF